MNLTKENLLKSDEYRSWKYEHVFSLARWVASERHVLTEAHDVQARLAANAKVKKRWETAFAFSFFAAIVHILALLSGHLFGFYESSTWVQLRDSGMGVLLVVSPFLWVAPFFVAYHFVGAREEKENDLMFEADMLKSIRGTDRCQEALKYVEAGHPEVLAWRDIAIAEHGQLCVFDVLIMDHLYRKAESNNRQALAKARTEEACKAVHGIGTTGGYAAV